VFLAGSYGHREFADYERMGFSRYDVDDDTCLRGGGGVRAGF
jgi:hypothetical protein